MSHWYQCCCRHRCHLPVATDAALDQIANTDRVCVPKGVNDVFSVHFYGYTLYGCLSQFEQFHVPGESLYPFHSVVWLYFIQSSPSKYNLVALCLRFYFSLVYVAHTHKYECTEENGPFFRMCRQMNMFLRDVSFRTMQHTFHDLN